MNITLYEKHDATQEKNVLRWCISMYMCHVIVLKQTRGIINITQKRATQYSWVSCSTGKSSTKKIVKHAIHFTLLQKNQAIVAVIDLLRLFEQR